jgi:hypothetical protein
MTHAVCIKCGAGKFDALMPCDLCHFLPVASKDCARSVLLSDRHYSLFELDRIGEAIRTGQHIIYDPEEILEAGTALETLEP